MDCFQHETEMQQLLLFFL